MAPKRDQVRADLYCSRSMCLALAESRKSLRVEHWRFRAEGLALFLRHVLDGPPRASQSRGNFAAQQRNGRGPGSSEVPLTKDLACLALALSSTSHAEDFLWHRASIGDLGFPRPTLWNEVELGSTKVVVTWAFAADPSRMAAEEGRSLPLSEASADLQAARRRNGPNAS